MDVNIAASLLTGIQHLLGAAHAGGGGLAGRRGGGRCFGTGLFGEVLALCAEQGIELGLREPAALEQQLAQPPRAALARLLRGHLLQLLARDELVMQRESAE